MSRPIDRSVIVCACFVYSTVVNNLACTSPTNVCVSGWVVCDADSRIIGGYCITRKAGCVAKAPLWWAPNESSGGLDNCSTAGLTRVMTFRRTHASANLHAHSALRNQS